MWTCAMGPESIYRDVRLVTAMNLHELALSNAFARMVMITGALFSLTACAQSGGQATAPSKALTQATLGDQSVHLLEVEGQCVLVKPDNSQLQMGMEWPCQFTPDKQGNVQTEVFKTVPIVLVEHSQANPAPDIECVKKSQAVRLRNDKLEISRVNKSAMCHIGQQDQKMFVGLFRW